EELRDRAAAVTPDEVHAIDVQRVEHSENCRELVIRSDALPLGDLGVTERQEIRRDTATMRRESVESTAPLKSVERKAVQEERGGSAATLDIRDAAEPRLHKPTGGVPLRRGGLGSAPPNAPER